MAEYASLQDDSSIYENAVTIHYFYASRVHCVHYLVLNVLRELRMLYIQLDK